MYVRKYPRDRENSVRPIIDYFSLSFITHSDADSLTKASLSLTVTFSTELSGRLALHANLISPSAVLCVSLNARTCNFTHTQVCTREYTDKKTHFVLLAAVCSRSRRFVSVSRYPPTDCALSARQPQWRT